MSKPCPVGGCGRPKMKGKQRCTWHWLIAQPAYVQKEHAHTRSLNSPFPEPRVRVPSSEWPDGERWCAGCQSFVPLFYTSGSRCKSCASTAAHESRVRAVYGLESGEYDALFKLQGGRCFICQRQSPSRRLAVDHDHETGRVRGLLCPDPERGCNHAILGNIRDIAMARRILLYLARTPYDRLKDGNGGLSWAEYVRQEAARQDALASQLRSGPLVQVPPF